MRKRSSLRTIHSIAKRNLRKLSASADQWFGSVQSKFSLETLRYVKTEEGFREVELPGRLLSEPARLLLAAINHRIAIGDIVRSVRGAQLADAVTLIVLRLINGVANESAQSGADEACFHGVTETLLRLSPMDLYTCLTVQAKSRLGLIRGLRMILSLERCVDHEARQGIAIRFSEEVWRLHGAEGLRALRDGLTESTAHLPQ